MIQAVGAGRPNVCSFGLADHLFAMPTTTIDLVEFLLHKAYVASPSLANSEELCDTACIIQWAV
jgi:hypothetical protein